MDKPKSAPLKPAPLKPASLKPTPLKPVAPKAAPARPAEPPPRSFVSLPLAQLLPRVTRPSFRKRSPAAADLLAEWDSVVGPRLAAETEPRGLTRGVLTIACAGPTALELQHLGAALIGRINTYAGTRLVERLRFIQAPIHRPAPPPAPRPRVPEQTIPGLEPGGLHDALARLQASIKSRT